MGVTGGLGCYTKYNTQFSCRTCDFWVTGAHLRCNETRICKAGAPGQSNVLQSYRRISQFLSTAQLSKLTSTQITYEANKSCSAGKPVLSWIANVCSLETIDETGATGWMYCKCYISIWKCNFKLEMCKGKFLPVELEVLREWKL